MGNRFREIFFPTPEEQEKQLKKLEEMRKAAREKKPKKLVPAKDGMMVAEPFESFYGDCETCKYYIDPNRGFITGGWCSLRSGAGCGYGFTCDKHEFKEKQEEI